MKARAKTNVIVVHHTRHADSDLQSIKKTFKKRFDADTAGYHWIIESDGTGFPGRNENLRGIHTVGANYRSLGVVLCGNFNRQIPSAAQLDELVRICAQWCFTYGLRPDSQTIVGHRDLQKNKRKDGVRVPNSCPGTKLYTKLPQIRAEVAMKIAHSQGASRAIGITA